MIKAESIQGDGFRISYIPPHKAAEANPMDFLCVKPYNIGREETAIVVDDPSSITGESHYILWGDYREQYKAVMADGLDASIAIFLANIQHISGTSDMPLITKGKIQ